MINLGTEDFGEIREAIDSRIVAFSAGLRATEKEIRSTEKNSGNISGLDRKKALEKWFWEWASEFIAALDFTNLQKHVSNVEEFKEGMPADLKVGLQRMIEEYFEISTSIKQGLQDDIEIQDDICKRFSQQWMNNEKLSESKLQKHSITNSISEMKVKKAKDEILRLQ